MYCFRKDLFYFCENADLWESEEGSPLQTTTNVMTRPVQSQNTGDFVEVPHAEAGAQRLKLSFIAFLGA